MTSIDKCRVSNCHVCQMLADKHPARVVSCNENRNQPTSVVMTNWVRVALPLPRQWCLLTTLRRQNVSVLHRTLAYIAQENNSRHDRNDRRGERSNQELTDWPIQLFAQTGSEWQMIKLLAQTESERQMRRKIRRRIDRLADTIIGTPSHSA